MIPADIRSLVPNWEGADDFAVERLGGLTNTNHLVTAAGEQYVVRIVGSNAGPLGIDRDLERQVLALAEDAGIGPAVVLLEPEGHLVTKRIDGRHWTVEEYRTPGNVQRVAEAVRRVHALPSVDGRFSPFRSVESYADQANALGVAFPDDWDTFAGRMREVEAEQRRDTSSWLRLCHNDLYGVNILDDGRVRIIDWEYAGMGDLYFDLGTLVYAFDSDVPLSADLKTLLLGTYFDSVTSTHHARLDGMEFMSLFFSAMWGLLQHGLRRQGAGPDYATFDPFTYAQGLFSIMRDLTA